jgi:succinate-acetate transporter protein
LPGLGFVVAKFGRIPHLIHIAGYLGIFCALACALLAAYLAVSTA